MNKKRNVIDVILIIVVVIQSLCIFSFVRMFNNKEVDISNNTKTYNNVAIMYETSEDSGEYTTVENTAWPSEGYKYNATLSKCENGSTMSWDDTNNKVNVTSNVSDKCYVYFDIYDPIKITDFTYSSRLSTELTLNIEATSEEGSITYYYSIDNGDSYVESTSGSHTFTGLTASTTYNVKIKIVDSVGNEKEYSSIATTKEFIEISFTIDETSYQAEEGMTWQDFVNSTYNKNNEFIINLDYTVMINDILHRIAVNLTAVYSYELIIADEEYGFALGTNPA